jgi:hypothetical protein
MKRARISAFTVYSLFVKKEKDKETCIREANKKVFSKECVLFPQGIIIIF